MKLKTLSGKSVHPIGIGTWGMGGTWEPVYGEEEQGIKAIRYSISKGQNHIDSGQIYGGGHTDDVIGQAIKDLPRKNLYIGDKVWETNVAKGKVRPAVESMLKKLGTDYLDLLYIHKPWRDWPWKEAIPQIDQLINEGLVRQFGASNFLLLQLKELMSLSKHPIVVNQLHYNIIYKQDADEAMQEFCKTHGIQAIAYKPLEKGEVLQNKTAQKIARERKVTPAQIALAWLLHHGFMAIPMAIEEKHIDQNLAALNIKLSPDEIRQLDSI